MWGRYGALCWAAWFCVIGGFGQRAFGAVQEGGTGTGVFLTTIRQLVEKNEGLVSLIKLEYVVRFKHSNPEEHQRKLELLVSGNARRKPRRAVPVMHRSGMWAQDGVRQHSTQNIWYADGEKSPGAVRVVDGEVYKYGVMPDLMQGTIDKIEEFPHRVIGPLRFGLRVLTGQYALREIFAFENASVCGEEVIDGRETYVVDATFPRGRYYIRAWIDQKAGVPLRVEYYNKHFSSVDRKLLGEIKDIKLHRLPNGGWFPIKGTRSVYFSDETISEHLEVDVNSVTIEHEGIPDSLFTLEFPEGARIYNAITGTKARRVSKQPPSLVGKPSPDIKSIISDFGPEQAKGQIVLVCFFDMKQRPSRNCIMQLSKKAIDLKAKNVVVVAVHASKVNQSVLDDWIKESNISFPIGMVEGDEEKIRFAWGVKALPWLILTDKKHIVQAEGFGINELDEQITTLREK